MRFVCGENAIRPQTDPTAKGTAHFWTKPAAVVSCAVHYGMRKCLLTVCSLAWQVADKLGVVRRCGLWSLIETWWLAISLYHLQCINTLYPDQKQVNYRISWCEYTLNEPKNNHFWSHTCTFGARSPEKNKDVPWISAKLFWLEQYTPWTTWKYVHSGLNNNPSHQWQEHFEISPRPFILVAHVFSVFGFEKSKVLLPFCPLLRKECF